MSLTTVALIGRPNVGKSTFFNRLVGRKLALVHDTPGLTRDRRYGKATLSHLEFDIIDTPGIETDHQPKQKDDLAYTLWHQTHTSIQEADVLFFIIDAQEPLTSVEFYLADLIRKLNKPCLLIINKAEGNRQRHISAEISRLGFKEPVPISAEHGEGLALLYESFEPLCSKPVATEGDEHDDSEQVDEVVSEESDPISVAVVGRPNVGKSTLINTIIGEERFTTGPEAGITRDALSVPFSWQNRPYVFVDTAGVRKKSKVTKAVESISIQETKRAIKYAEVVLLVLDAQQALDKQDLTIAHHVFEEGRCLIFVINKIDLIPDFQKFVADFIKDAQELFPQIKRVPFVFVSAKQEKNLSKIFHAIQDVYKEWNTRISTAQLNQWLGRSIAHHPPPLVNNIRIKIKYATQIKRRPPTFALFTNKVAELPESYLRYLRNSLAQHFKLEQIPLRLYLRKPDNPFMNR